MLALADPQSESWSGNNYIPRDEAFSEVKQESFSPLRSAIPALLPYIDGMVTDPKLGFPYFTSIDALYNEGMRFPKKEGLDLVLTFVPRLVKTLAETAEQILRFETPEMIDSKFLTLPWHYMTKTRNAMQRACNRPRIQKKCFP